MEENLRAEANGAQSNRQLSFELSRTGRGVLSFLAGGICCGVALQVISVVVASQGRPSSSRHSATSPQLGQADVAKYAFVQLAYDEPGRPLEQIWRVMAMARTLQRLSQYPLVVLTNTTHLPGNVEVARSVSKLNVQVLPVYDIPAPKAARFNTNSQRYGFWKLQAWRLTQFDKLIWMDTDAILTRSVDWLFQRRPLWAQGDDQGCLDSEDQHLGGGIMIIEPDQAVFDNMMDFANSRSAKWWTSPGGDLRLLSEYFASTEGRRMRLFQQSTAAYDACLGRLSGFAREPTGQLDLPAFVHATAKDKDCLYWDVAEQLSEVEGQMVNVCHYHPLGQYWRDAFCQAVNVVGAKPEAIEAFCDDLRWSTAGSLEVELTGGLSTARQTDVHKLDKHLRSSV